MVMKIAASSYREFHPLRAIMLERMKAKMTGREFPANWLS